VEILERCEAECALIAQLAIEPATQAKNEKLASVYRVNRDRLKDRDHLPVA
jgi:hypothetical protein